MVNAPLQHLPPWNSKLWMVRRTITSHRFCGLPFPNQNRGVNRFFRTQYLPKALGTIFQRVWCGYSYRVRKPETKNSDNGDRGGFCCAFNASFDLSSQQKPARESKMVEVAIHPQTCYSELGEISRSETITAIRQNLFSYWIAQAVSGNACCAQMLCVIWESGCHNNENVLTLISGNFQLW